MGRNRFTPATVDRVPLSDGDWIEVKHELNNGDHKKLEAAGLKPPTVVNGKVISPIDWEVYEIERAMIFLTDWSFKGADDKPVPLNIAAVRALDIDTFNEINHAIFQHVAEVSVEKKAKKEREAKEKEKGGSPSISTESASPPPTEKSSPTSGETSSGPTSS